MDRRQFIKTSGGFMVGTATALTSPNNSNLAFAKPGAVYATRQVAFDIATVQTNDVAGNGQFRLLDAIMNETVADLQCQGDPGEVIPTGFGDLDYVLNGGLRRGSVTVVAARPSIGRSALARGIAENTAVGGNAVLVFTSGEGRRSFAIWATSKILGVENVKLRRRPGTASNWKPVLAEKNQEISAYGKLPIAIDDTPSLAPETLRDRIVGMCNREPFPGLSLGLVVVDGLEALRLADDSQDQVILAATAMQTLSGLAKAEGLAILVTVPVLRHIEERPDKVPGLKDLWGAGLIEQIGDVVIALYRDAVYNPECEEADFDLVDLFVQKNEFGYIGRAKLRFTKGRFHAMNENSVIGSL